MIAGDIVIRLKPRDFTTGFTLGREYVLLGEPDKYANHTTILIRDDDGDLRRRPSEEFSLKPCPVTKIGAEEYEEVMSAQDIMENLICTK